MKYSIEPVNTNIKYPTRYEDILGAVDAAYDYSKINGNCEVKVVYNGFDNFIEKEFDVSLFVITAPDFENKYPNYYI